MGLGKLLMGFFGEVKTDKGVEEDTKMDILQAIDGFRWRYFHEIKPLIQKQQFDRAYLELDEIVVYLERYNNLDLWTKVHSGPNYLSSLQQLCGYLQKGKEVPVGIIEQFEAYQAQTKLPLRRVQ